MQIGLPCKGAIPPCGACRWPFWQPASKAHLEGQLELVEPVAQHRHAQVAAAMLHDERQLGGRRVLRRQDEVALVLAVLVVQDDDVIARSQLRDRLCTTQR